MLYSDPIMLYGYNKSRIEPIMHVCKLTTQLDAQLGMQIPLLAVRAICMLKHTLLNV